MYSFGSLRSAFSLYRNQLCPLKVLSTYARSIVLQASKNRRFSSVRALFLSTSEGLYIDIFQHRRRNVQEINKPILFSLFISSLGSWKPNEKWKLEFETEWERVPEKWRPWRTSKGSCSRCSR